MEFYIWHEHYPEYNQRMKRITETVKSWIEWSDYCKLSLVPKE